MQVNEKMKQYLKLMRFHQPIGFFLLLWPTLWALWLANGKKPDGQILLIFILGTLVMRALGCVINDYIDKEFDGFVGRTCERPLVTGKVSPKEALYLAFFLACLAFILVLFCNVLTIVLAFIGLILAIIYPFLKRITYLPQLGLSVAFVWGIPMAFAAQLDVVNFNAWFLYFTALIWPLIYDTFYAMVDREDDDRIGIKSTALLFNSMDKLIILLLQCLFVSMLAINGLMFHLKQPYFFCLGIVLVMFIYQQWLIKARQRDDCFRAFLSNNWVGAFIFLGIILSV